MNAAPNFRRNRHTTTRSTPRPRNGPNTASPSSSPLTNLPACPARYVSTCNSRHVRRRPDCSLESAGTVITENETLCNPIAHWARTISAHPAGESDTDTAPAATAPPHTTGTSRDPPAHPGRTDTPAHPGTNHTPRTNTAHSPGPPPPSPSQQRISAWGSRRHCQRNEAVSGLLATTPTPVGGIPSKRRPRREQPLKPLPRVHRLHPLPPRV